MSQINWVLEFCEVEDILDSRRRHIEESFNWIIPQLVWDDFIDYIRGSGELYGSPAEIVDNIAVNGDYFDIYEAIGSCDCDLIQYLNSSYDTEFRSFDIYKYCDEIENITGAFSFVHESYDPSDYSVVDELFMDELKGLFEDYKPYVYVDYEIYEDKIHLKIINEDKRNEIEKSIEEEFGYLMEADNKEYRHLGILNMRKIENNDYDYEFDIFAVPFMYFIRSY